MKHIKTGKKRGKFNSLAHTRELQAAMMTLRPGGTSDDEPSNEHSGSEQWLFVISGLGEAKIGKRHGQLRRVKLEIGSLLIIEKASFTKSSIRASDRYGRSTFTLRLHTMRRANQSASYAGCSEQLISA
jgi:hypothetical protein